MSRSVLQRTCFAAILLTVLFSVPNALFADHEESRTQYCPDGRLFSDGIHYEGTAPWIELIVDPEFEQKTMKPRNVPLPLTATPIYDLIVRIKPVFNYYCVPGWIGHDGPGREVVSGDLPESVPVKGFITVGSGKEVIKVVGPGTFVKTKAQDAEKRFIYEWKLKGWPNGIASGDKIEQLLEALAAGTIPSIIIEISRKDGELVIEEGGASLSLCASVFGRGEHSVMYNRAGGGTYPLTELIKSAEDIRTQGFEAIEPYRTYNSRFSHSIDLAMYSAPWFSLIDDLSNSKRRLTRAMHNQIFNEAAESFGCQAKTHVVISPVSPYEGVSSLGGSALFVHAKPSYPLPFVVMHEFSHAFASLNDEYEYDHTRKLMWSPFRNCSLHPSTDWVYKGKRYGDTDFRGCSIRTASKRVGQEEVLPTYRPSFTSLMKGHKSGGEKRLNVVSCGYVIASIKGGEGPEFWPECMGLDTVKPSGVSALDSFDIGLPRLLTAQAGAGALPPESENVIGAIFENFSSEDPGPGFIGAEEGTGVVSGEAVDGIAWRELRGEGVVELFDETGAVFKTIPVPKAEKKERPDENALIAELYRKVGDLGADLEPRIQGAEVPESGRVGSPLRITWRSDGVEHVKLELLHYRRNQVERVLEESVPNQDAYDWTIPEGLSDDVYRIRVSDASNPAVQTVSGKFDIESPERGSLWKKVAELFRGSDTLAPQPAEQNVRPAAPEHAGVNLTAPTLVLRGGAKAADGSYLESDIAMLGAIGRTGNDDVRSGFKSSIRYAPLGGGYAELVSFDVPALPKDKGAQVEYAFTVKPGKWRFMLCADSESAIAETVESDNCSEPLELEVRGDAAAPVRTAGTPELTLSVPLWTGTSAGGGRLRAGDMSLSVKIRNVGDGISGPVKGLWQYAVAMGQWNDWVDVEFPPIEPDASIESNYSWQGGAGLWRARFCTLESSAPEGRLCSGAVAVEIIQ